MRALFVPPPITTRSIRGHVELIASFAIELVLEPRETEMTVRGTRIHQRILGGTITGPRLRGSVYPNGGGEFGVVRSDGVEEWFTRMMLRAENGEWLYTHLTAYVRPDGYARCQAVFDADVQGPHAWLNETIFIGTIMQDADGTRRVTHFFEAA